MARPPKKRPQQAAAEDPQARLARFLPRTREQMALRGWDELDVLLVSGDAYVDHSSFGVAALGRFLESEGLRVGILDVPDLEPDGSGWKRLPAPRLFVGGDGRDHRLDGHELHRRQAQAGAPDVYRPGGVAGTAEPSASIAYTGQAARHHFPGVPVDASGDIEAGPRRLAYYD